MSRLLDSVREAVRTRHLGSRTGQAYSGRVGSHILSRRKRRPSRIGADEIG